MSEIIEFITSISPVNRIALSAGFAALVTVFALWNALLVRDPMAGRVKHLNRHRDAMRSGLLAPNRHEALRTLAIGTMRQIINRLNLMRTTQAAKTMSRLAQAGWRSKDALVTYLFLKISLPFVFGDFAALILFGGHALALQLIVKTLIAMVAVICGAYLPEVLLANAI